MNNHYEYNMLKTEIMQCVELEFNTQIAMITTVIAIFAIAIQCNNAWIFIITYLPLIFYQSIMNNKRNNRQKISAYIDVFYSDESLWEHLIYILPNKMKLKENKYSFKKQYRFFSKMWSFIFSLLTLLCSTVMQITQIWCTNELYFKIISPLIIIFIGVIFNIIILKLNKKAYNAKLVFDEYKNIFIRMKNESSNNCSTAN